MSLSAARARSAAPAASENDPTKCAAYGCKCRASVNIGGKGWACFAHAFAEVEDWQQITRGLHEHDWLLGLVNEVRRLDRLFQDWREFSMQFWANADTFCQPQPFENCVPYQNRMLMELLHRIGQLPKRPQPREPRHLARPTGRFASAKAVDFADVGQEAR